MISPQESQMIAPSQRERSSGEERSVGELFGELADEMSTLVRQEIKLATTEMTQKANHAGKQATFIAIGGLLAVVSLITLAAALVLGLGKVVALWVSALIVGVVLAAIATAFVLKGVRSLQRMELAPRQTIETIKEDKSWVQQQVR